MSKEEKTLTFTVDAKELKKAEEWMKKQKEKHGSIVGTIGDRFSYEFIPTGLGVMVYCNDGLSNESECLSDIANW